MGEKIDWSKFDEAEKKLNVFGALASPAYTVTDRLVRAFCEVISSAYSNMEEMLSSDIANKTFINMIAKRRHDHLKLETVLIVLDNQRNKKDLPKLKEALLELISDSEIKSLLGSKDNTVDYIRQTIRVDALIQYLESRAMFIEKKDRHQFHKEVKALIRRVYDMPENLKKIA